MARNAVQFQKGLSMAGFNQLYGTEDLCHAALVAMRWPGGFVCPKCEGTAHSFCAPRKLFQCRKCRAQTSVRAGTIFHKSRVPLTKWFLCMHLLSGAKNDIASLELARQLDVKWDTAWLMKQKLMEVMLQRNSIYKLAGDIQVDDAYIGGEKPGKRGRGAGNKHPFVIAVATRDGRPIYTQMRCMPFTKDAITAYAKASIAEGSSVVSDGLACFNGFEAAGFKHTPVIKGGRADDSRFKWVDTGLGNIKSAIRGTCRSCDPQHTPRYLAAFEWRYNRRFNLAKNLSRLGRVATATKPKPHAEIIRI
jgi:ISXO2-like transposase domain/Transposase zinc-ribbon domain